MPIMIIAAVVVLMSSFGLVYKAGHSHGYSLAQTETADATRALNRRVEALNSDLSAEKARHDVALDQSLKAALATRPGDSNCTMTEDQRARLTRIK